MINMVKNFLNQILIDHPPRSILCVGRNISGALTQFVTARPQCRIREINPTQINGQYLDLSAAMPWRDNSDTFDFGIVSDCIEHLTKNNAIHLLARLRDLYTKKLLIVVPIGDEWSEHQSRWQETELLALGFIVKARLRFDEKPVHVYAFDIATYKTTPDWLNSKYWANPQLWDKYWW